MGVEYNIFLNVFHVAVQEAIQLNKRLSALNKKQESEICSLKKVGFIQFHSIWVKL